MSNRLLVLLLTFLALTPANAEEFDSFTETWRLHQEYCVAELDSPSSFVSHFQDAIRQFKGGIYEANDGQYVYISWVKRYAYFHFTWKDHPDGYDINCRIGNHFPLSLDSEIVSHDLKEAIDANNDLSWVGGRLENSKNPSQYHFSILGLMDTDTYDTEISFSEYYFFLGTHIGVRH